MGNVTLRIVYVPEVTDVYVTEDGEHYSKIVTEEHYQESDDYAREISVAPGKTKIKFVAVPDGVEHYFWSCSSDAADEETPIGDGSEMNVCILTVPADIPDGMNLYIEEDYKEVDFGYDSRDFNFKAETGAYAPDASAFVIVHEDYPN